MLKEVGASGHISLGRRFAGQLFEVTFHDDGRVELLPVQSVPARGAGAGAGVGVGVGGDVKAPDAWVPPSGYDACNAWALENRLALEAYAQRIAQDRTAAEQLQTYLAAPPVATDA